MIKEDIKSYICKLEGSLYNGSGVLIRSKKGKFYIFTAKHNLKTTTEQELSKLEIGEIKECIDNDEINILLPYPNIKITDVIGLDDAYIDFIVLVIDSNGENLNEIFEKKPLSIFAGSFRGECGLGGYPTDEVRCNSIEYFNCEYSSDNKKHERKDDYEYVFELESKKDLYEVGKSKKDTISGISGGGVFVQDKDDNIYLVGIEIEYIGIKSLIYVSLKKIIYEINQKLIDDEMEVVEEIELNNENSKSKQKESNKIEVDNGVGIVKNFIPKEELSIEKVIKILLGIILLSITVAILWGIKFLFFEEKNNVTVTDSKQVIIAQNGSAVNVINNPTPQNLKKLFEIKLKQPFREDTYLTDIDFYRDEQCTNKYRSTILKNKAHSLMIKIDENNDFKTLYIENKNKKLYCCAKIKIHTDEKIQSFDCYKDCMYNKENTSIKKDCNEDCSDRGKCSYKD